MSSVILVVAEERRIGIGEQISQYVNNALNYIRFQKLKKHIPTISHQQKNNTLNRYEHRTNLKTKIHEPD